MRLRRPAPFLPRASLWSGPTSTFGDNFPPSYYYIYIYVYGPSPLLVAPDVGQAHATGLGPWVLHWLGLPPTPPPAPAPGPWAPPAPPRVNLLTRSLRELTRSLRGGLCSVPKGRKAIATGIPKRGPGEEGQVQRGPGGLLKQFRWRGTAEGSNTLFVSILVELMFFAGFPFHVIFPVAYSLQPTACCLMASANCPSHVACGILPISCNLLPVAYCVLSSCIVPIAHCLLHNSYDT